MRDIIYNGTTKTLYQGAEEYSLIMTFTDNAKIENGSVAIISGKGVINNDLSSFIMNRLDMAGIDNHLIEKINMREQLVQFVDVFPVQLSVSSIACGRYVSQFGIEEGYVFDNPIIDFKIKNSSLNYPIINEYQILSFGWLSKTEIHQLKNKAIRVHSFLTGLFAGIGVRLVECNLEFGKVFNGEEFIIMIADEISFDNCRLWDISSNEKLSFELMSTDPTNAIHAYQKVMNRFNEKW